MSGVLMRKDREKLGISLEMLKELKSIFIKPWLIIKVPKYVGGLIKYIKSATTYFSYGGRVTVKDSQIIIHHVDYSSIPDLVGGDQVRNFEFIDGNLTLSVIIGDKNQVLKWKRATSF